MSIAAKDRPVGRIAYMDQPGFVTRKALAIKHVDRYEGRYLWQALEFLRDHGPEYPFETMIDAVFSLDEVGTALKKSLNREVVRAAISITESAGNS